MTIRSPLAFMRARSGTRTFLGGVFIGPSSILFRFPRPWLPASHAAKPSGLPTVRRNNTVASPELEHLAENSNVTEQSRCPLSQWGRSNPRRAPGGESSRCRFWPVAPTYVVRSSVLLPPLPAFRALHRGEQR